MAISENMLIRMAYPNLGEVARVVMEMTTLKVGMAMFFLAGLHFAFIWWYFRGRNMSRKYANSTAVKAPTKKGGGLMLRLVVFTLAVAVFCAVLSQIPLDHGTALQVLGEQISDHFGLKVLLICILGVALTLVIFNPKSESKTTKVSMAQQRHQAVMQAHANYILQQALLTPALIDTIEPDKYENRVPLSIRANAYVGKHFNAHFGGEPVRILNEAEIRRDKHQDYLEVTRLLIEEKMAVIDLRFPAAATRIGLRFVPNSTPSGTQWLLDHVTKTTY